MKYYLTKSDSEFSKFAKQFRDNFAEIAAELNFDEDEIKALEESVDEFANDIKNQADARTTLSSLTVRKNTSKKNARTLIRNASKKLRANSKVTDQQLVRLDLPIRDEILSRQSEPEGAPMLEIEISPRGLHKLEIRKEGFSRGKPKTAVGAEVWVFVGDRKDLTEKNMRYLGTATRLKFEAEHDLEDAGKTAHYMARWITRRGIRGGWSVTKSATIAA